MWGSPGTLFRVLRPFLGELAGAEKPRRQFYGGREEEMPLYRSRQEERRLVQGACVAYSMSLCEHQQRETTMVKEHPFQRAAKEYETPFSRSEPPYESPLAAIQVEGECSYPRLVPMRSIPATTSSRSHRTAL